MARFAGIARSARAYFEDRSPRSRVLRTATVEVRSTKYEVQNERGWS